MNRALTSLRQPVAQTATREPMSLNQSIRKYVPSVSTLTYSRLFRLVSRLTDLLPRMVWKEFRALPPNELRCRVGVGNRLFTNQVLHIRQGYDFWLHAASNGWFDFSSDIVEIGVGCGRRAFHIRDFRLSDSTFTGTYLGIDIDGELLDWCRRNFDSRFTFEQSTHASASYVNEEAAEGYYRVPRADASVDFFLGTSVLTHLLEPQLRNYLEEGARVLRPGRTLAMTCFALDLAPSTMGDRHSFSHRVGNAYVESLSQPEAAVAYESEFLERVALESGFADARIMHHASDVQHVLVCTR